MRRGVNATKVAGHLIVATATAAVLAGCGDEELPGARVSPATTSAVPGLTVRAGSPSAVALRFVASRASRGDGDPAINVVARRHEGSRHVVIVHVQQRPWSVVHTLVVEGTQGDWRVTRTTLGPTARPLAR